MFESYKNSLKVALVYATTIIGAGFASGQEIMLFFTTYQSGGGYGIILAGFLFSIIGYIVLDAVFVKKIKNEEDFLAPIIGKKLASIIQVLILLFLFCIFIVMIAGIASILAEKVHISYKSGVIIGVVVSFFAMLSSIRGIVVISAITTPILIISIVFVGIYILATDARPVFFQSESFQFLTNNWVFSAIIYVSYNTLLSINILCGLLPYLKKREIALFGGVGGGILLSLLAILLNCTLSFFWPEISSMEFPVIGALEKTGFLFVDFYSDILLLAMVVSAITSGFCIKNRICEKYKLKGIGVALIICFLVIPFSGMGFSGVISNIYPVFGYFGMFVITAILFYGIKELLLPAFLKSR